MPKINRKLATILATDCVDFSKFMESQEVLTLANLTACREIIDPIIEEHGGRIFHTAGDSVIADFGSPVECVHAAMKFQEALAARNEAVEEGPKLEWRVGIHVDDVITEGENIYGSGVNIAARLEAQCEPGKVLLSRIVQEQVQKRVEFNVSPAGTRALKNISDEFEVFYIAKGLNESCVDGQTVHATTRDTPKSKLEGVSKKPRLAILPFTNDGRDEDSGYLADGIVEDLITEFSMIREFEIVSSKTSFDFRDKGGETSEFAAAHDLDFIISGGIRSSGKRVRISLELSEVESGKAIWRDRYDRVIEDIFDLQDEIVRTITISLLGEIEISSLQRAKRKATENISSYEFLLRGKEMHHRFTQEANIRALEFFDLSIEADPSNAQAYAWKACTIGQGVVRGFLEGDPDRIVGQAMDSISSALELNANDFECHRMLSAVYLSQHDYQLAEEHGRKAYDMNPNDPRVLAGYGEVLARVGKPEKGVELLEKALSLDPIPQGQMNSDNRYTDLTLAYFHLNDLGKCIEIGKKVEHINFKSWLFVTYSKYKIGDLDEKEAYFKQGLEEFKEGDWDLKVDRLHLPSEKTQSDLLKFLKDL
ncbi:MAG TPA: adenylate/guanylate cyclase domain-containing protein [Gammaproteobacteria bacterium]|nr:adenylate/guanylate cyclase domain-containing protein [Gammaproteobacteria bacterium]